MGMGKWSTVFVTLLVITLDVLVSSISFSKCSWTTFTEELHKLTTSDYDYRTSQFELWIFCVVRSLVNIIGIVLVCRTSKLVGQCCLAVTGLLSLMASYTPVKLLAIYEFTHDLRLPYFWLGFGFNIYACLVSIILWYWPLSNVEHATTVNVLLDDDTQTLIPNGHCTMDKKDENENEFEPKVKPVDSFLLLARLLGYCKGEWPLYVLGFSFLLCYSVARVFIPLYTGKVISNIVITKSYKDLLHSVFILSMLTLASAICGGLRGGCFSYAIARVSRKLRSDLFLSLVKQEMGFFDTIKTGDMTSRLTADCQTIGDTVGFNTNIFLRNLVMFIGSFVVMIGLSWQMTTITFIAMPTIAIITKVYGSYIDKLSKETQDTLAKANEIAEEVIGSMRTVRSFANETGEAHRYRGRLDEVLRVKVRQTIATVGYMWSTEMFDLGLIVAIMWYGGHLVLSGQLSGESMIQILLYQLQLGEALIQMGYVFTGLMQSVGASRKVFEYIDRKPKIPNQGKLKPPKLQGRIDFKNVCFSYPARSDTQVLNNMSFSVSPGETVALVGPSGGGKSSCIALLQHLYEPSSGTITIDSNAIHVFDHKYLHTKMALVGQEPVLYARSIQENIAYSMAPTPQDKDLDSVPFNAIVNAAEAANASEFIQAQKDKYDTQVGEKGVQLSGGQKQRIAIARALIRQPVILLLDEATSALDAESEHLVQEALYRNLKGHTVLLIAHRLSTVERADRIVVIDKGKAVQQGTHAELLSQEGIYKTLVSRQLLGTHLEDYNAGVSIIPTPSRGSSVVGSYRSVHSIESSGSISPPNE